VDDTLWEDNMPVIMNLIERTRTLEEVAETALERVRRLEGHNALRKAYAEDRLARLERAISALARRVKARTFWWPRTTCGPSWPKGASRRLSRSWPGGRRRLDKSTYTRVPTSPDAFPSRARPPGPSPFTGWRGGWSGCGCGCAGQDSRPGRAWPVGGWPIGEEGAAAVANGLKVGRLRAFRTPSFSGKHRGL
jgi:hypothetical protein